MDVFPKPNIPWEVHALYITLNFTLTLEEGGTTCRSGYSEHHYLIIPASRSSCVVA